MYQALLFLTMLSVVVGCTVLDSTILRSDTRTSKTSGAFYYLPKALLHIRILKTSGDVKQVFH